MSHFGDPGNTTSTLLFRKAIRPIPGCAADLRAGVFRGVYSDAPSAARPASPPSPPPSSPWWRSSWPSSSARPSPLRLVPWPSPHLQEQARERTSYTDRTETPGATTICRPLAVGHFSLNALPKWSPTCNPPPYHQKATASRVGKNPQGGEDGHCCSRTAGSSRLRGGA